MNAINIKLNSLVVCMCFIKKIHAVYKIQSTNSAKIYSKFIKSSTIAEIENKKHHKKILQGGIGKNSKKIKGLLVCKIVCF